VKITTALSGQVRTKVPFQTFKYGSKSGRECLDAFGMDLPLNSAIFVYFSGGYWQALSGDISAYVVPPLYNVGVHTVIVDYDRAPEGVFHTHMGLTRDMQRQSSFCFVAVLVAVLYINNLPGKS
jgi:acetyl esterase/lipase